MPAMLRILQHNHRPARRRAGTTEAGFAMYRMHCTVLCCVVLLCHAVCYITTVVSDQLF
jgi:hypothetical protein